MPVRKELCRNFQRGSCYYGERCKFSHITQQQSKHGSFAFGVQNSSYTQSTNSQQQNPNPFGFGVKDSTVPKVAVDTRFKQNQKKPFENKWIRSSTTNDNTPSLRQPENERRAEHKCTDPNSCKRQILEDFENEMPLWKLTCYSHVKCGPCEISGDISYEELRASAYVDAKSGLSLQTIIDKERSLVNSKMTEFQSLLHNQHTGMNRGSSFLAPQSSFPHAVSIFSPNGASGQPISASGQSNPSQNSLNFNGTFGGQLLNTKNGYPSVVNSAIFNNSSSSREAIQRIPTMNETETQNVVIDTSIWMKEWKIGEIPEEAPPEGFVY